MKQLTSLEIDKAAILKTWRTAIRAKYSVLADREIAETLPALEKRIDHALAVGQTLELSPADVWDEV